MNPKKAAALQIGLALIFAGAIISADALFGERSSTARNIIIAVWWVPFSYLCATASQYESKCGVDKGC